MKKAFVLVAVMMASHAFADGSHHGKMGDNLDLNEQQKTQMQDLRQKHREEGKALHDKQRTETRAILTPEQAAKFDAMKDDRMKSMKDKHSKTDKKDLKKVNVKK